MFVTVLTETRVYRKRIYRGLPVLATILEQPIKMPIAITLLEVDMTQDLSDKILLF
jgi:hypothetical protein